MECDVATPDGAVHFFDLHLASPHNQFEEVITAAPNGKHDVEVHLAVRAEQSIRISALAKEAGPNVVVAGDFNSIAEGSIYRESWSEFSDSFTTAGFGLGHTYFSEGAAVRIDHILTGTRWHCVSCRVGPYIGSPHRPVIADVVGDFHN
jgi:endonuclease/exonuclease/phosphatase (EEP) superfamily protein YafD